MRTVVVTLTVAFTGFVCNTFANMQTVDRMFLLHLNDGFGITMLKLPMPFVHAAYLKVLDRQENDFTWLFQVV